MANSIKLEVMTPSKVFYKSDIELVIATTLEGDEGFMANHSHATKLLDVGELWIQEAGAAPDDFKVAAIAGGYIDVRDSIIIFTDAAEWQEDIDKERAARAKAEAEGWLAEDKEHEPDEIARAQITIAKSIIRMRVAEGGMRHRR